MKKLLFVAVLSMISTLIFAQKVVLCEDYDKTTGVPSGVYASWNVKSSGSYIYTIYTQSKPITKTLSVYIDKKSSSGSYVAYETHFIEESESKGRKWAMIDLKFSEAGDYKISISDGAGNELASTYAVISYIDDEDEDNDDDEIDTYYYENSEISIAEDINKSTYEIINKTDEAYLSSIRGKEFYIIVENDKVFKTNLFYVGIYLGDDLLETLEIDVEEGWDIAWTNYSFTKKGNYTIDVYNADDIYVNTTEFVVK
ncbi:MAG: hypothetical protein IPK18_01340 [Sphingobacteriales bacterium]|jgi:hypothetical protein|nr:MAG: hypothetical protein IPK18_01340 [Sphingobacteriales bacterium]